MDIIPLDIEKTDSYQDALRTKKLLELLRYYYQSTERFDEMDLGDFSIRDLLLFMSDFGFPKRQFASNIEEIIKTIDEEIARIDKELKLARLREIEKKNLNSLLIIPSWSALLEKKTLGFYLNRPVIEIRKDTIIMLNNEIEIVQDKLGVQLAMISGPGILFTEFSLDKGKFITNVREINMVLLPMDHFEKLMNAPPIFEGDIHGSTINELITMIPFSIIEEAYSIQAMLRGVISRNIFLPNKAAIDAFNTVIKDPESFRPSHGFSILSAHPDYYNRLLLTGEGNPNAIAKGDSSYSISSAGIASIINGRTLLNEIIPDKQEQEKLLIKIRDVKFQYIQTGEKLIYDWIP